MTPARVLVTGANGFIGRALVDSLTQGGIPVTAAVRHQSTFEPQVPTYAVGDLGPRTNWRPVLLGCQRVVHLAAKVHTSGSVEEFRRVNVAATLALAVHAADAGVKRLIFISSSKVNGEATAPGKLFTEGDLPAPADQYGQSKAEAEAELLTFAQVAPIEIVVIRPPLVYGPGAKENFLRLVQLVARRIPLPLASVVGNHRTLVGVDNLVDLITLTLHHPAAANQVFLAGDGEDVSTADLLRRIGHAMGVPARLFPVPVSLLRAAGTVIGRRDQVRRLCGNLQVDTSKARQLLGWEPKHTVDDGLRRAVQLFSREANP